MSGYGIAQLTELGLAAGGVQVTPQFVYGDVIPTGFGGVQADLQWRLASAEITATLIHHDNDVLDVVMDESMANGGLRWEQGVDDVIDIPGPFGSIFVGRLVPGVNGIMAPTGRLLDGRKEMYASGNHFFSVNLISTSPEPQGGVWRFRKCHLANPPIVVPLGTDVQAVKIKFRALPYQDPYRTGYYSGSVQFANVPLARPYAGVRSGVEVQKRREVLGSGAILWDRTLDQSGVFTNTLLF